MNPTTYRALWRWHFHAGLFCIPFVVVLAITGSLYLFKPQIDALADRDVDGLEVSGPPAAPTAQVAAALSAVPGSQLAAYELPRRPGDAVRIHLRTADRTRVTAFVHPVTPRTLKVVRDETRFTEVVKSIHGELLAGTTGSILVELAACWALVMVVTGLYLWWPRGATGLAGVLYPRLRSGRATFWRDVHAVTGCWISALVLFLLLTSLPWTTVWGGAFKGLRGMAAAAEVKQDWKTGHVSDTEADGPHAAHRLAAGPAPTALAPAFPLDAVVAKVAALHLASPVLVVPPTDRLRAWSARSESQNRTLRRELTLDAHTGAIVSATGFADRKAIDRVIGVGISAHEGQLFGLANQLLGLAAAFGVILLCVSAVILWWRRRPQGSFGIPARKVAGFRIERTLAILITLLAVLLPVFGASLLVVAAVDRWLLAPRAATPSSA
jgi:uncharacterized iron-regulated membrane protein